MKIKLGCLPGLLPLLVLLTLHPGAARAAALTWDGSANGLWTNAANWTPAFRPTNGDALLFPHGVAQTFVTNSPGGATNYHSITIAGSNYVLRSPFLALTNGLTNGGPIGATNTIAARVVLRTNQTWEIASGNTLTLASNVSFTNFTLTVAASGTLQFSNTLTGGAGSVLNKTNGGTLKISGAASLTQLNVQAGELQMDGAYIGGLAVSNGAMLSGTGSVAAFSCSGTLSPGGTGVGVFTTVGSPSFGAGATVLFHLNGTVPGVSHDQFKIPAAFLGFPPALQVVTGYSPLLGDSFVIVTNTGGAALPSNFSGLSEGATQTVDNIQFRISYVGGNGNDVTLTVVGFTASGVTRMWDGEGANSLWSNPTNWAGDVVPGLGDDLVFPEGALQRTNVNDFAAGRVAGSITIDEGGYSLSGANALVLLNGLSASTALQSARVNLRLTLFQSQTFSQTGGAGLSVEQDVVLPAGSLTVSNTGSVNWQPGAHLSGPGSLVKTGAGNLSLFGSNSFTGPVSINQGRISARSAFALGSPAGGTTVGTGTTLELNAIGTTFNMTEPLTVLGTVQLPNLSVTNQGPLTVSSTNAVFEIQVLTSRLEFTGDVLSGAPGAGLVKTSPGTLALQGAGTLERTLIQAGTVLVNGAQPSNHVSLQSSGTLAVLGGSGTVGNISSINLARLAPGPSPGLLTCSNVAMTNTHFVVELNGTTAGTGYDQLNVRGTVRIGSSAFLDVSNNFATVPGDKFILINNDGADEVSGTFNLRPEGVLLTNGTAVQRLSYTGGDGNDVTLTTAAILPTGVTRVWDGGGVNNFWSNPTNWAGDVTPAPGDTIIFPTSLGAGDFLTTNDLPSGFVVEQIIFRNGSGGVGTQLRGNALGLLNGILATNTADAVIVSLPLVLAGPQTFALSAQSFTFSGDIALNGDLTFGGGSNISAAVGGPISGAGGVIKSCPGGLTLSGNNSFDGAVQLLNGNLGAGHASALGAAGGGTFVGTGTTLLLTLNDTLLESSIIIVGQVSITADCGISGEVQLPNTFTSFNASPGRQLILSGRLTGAGAPLFQGGGTFLLSGTNDCAGETTVQSSTLRVDGRSTGGNLNATVGSTLGGTGVVGQASVANGGTLNPGASPGVLTSGDISFFAPSTLLLELNGTNPGTQYDQLNVNGSVSLSGVSLTLAFGFTPLIGSSFTLIANDGADAITGTFNGLPEAATFTTNAATFRISYVGGDGNDVTLTRVLAASGVTRVWDGGGANAAWSNRTNWVGDVAPLEGDDLIFPSVAARKNNTNDFPAFFGFNSLTIADGYILGAAGVTLNAGLFATNGGGPTLNLPVLLNGSQSNFIAAGTTLTVNNGINLGAHTLTWGVEGLLNLSGQLSGSGGLTKVGGGAVTLSGTNTLTGPMEFRGSSVSINSSNVFGSAAGATTIGAGTIMQFNSGVTVDEPFVLNGLNASAVTMQFISGTSTLSGPITLGAQSGSVRFNPQAGEVRLNGPLTGGSLVKVGAGRLVLNGANLHTNVTSLEAGTLLINGSQLFSAVEVIGASSILGGTGTTARAVLSGGTLSPGTSPGRITFVGGLTNSANVTNFFELNGSTPGSGYDQIAVVGNVGLNGCVLRLSFGYTPAFGEAFTLIDNQGLNPIGGTFAGLPEGSMITNGPVVTRLTYQGGTGNDVVLTRIAVPTLITRIWDGGGADSLWSNPLNWAGDISPQQGDDVVLPGTVAKAPLFDAGTNIAYNTLLLGRAYSITVAAGNSMRLINSLTATNTTGVINLHVPVTLENNQLWNIGHPGAQLIVRGPVDLSFATLTHVGAGGLSFTARVTGGGGLSGNSSGTLALSGTNDFNGTVTANSGTLEVQSPGALGSTLAGTFVGTAGRLSMGLPNGGAINEPIIMAGRVDVVLGVTNNWNGSVTLAGTQTAFDTLNSGTLLVNGTLSGGGWQTLGLGSLVLNSPASFTGPFRVGGGARVFVNEDHSAMFFTLTNTGILGGTGTVGQISATTCAGCSVAPGSRDMPGVLRSSSVTLAPGATLRARVNGLVAGTDYDQLDAIGSVTLTGSSLVVTNGFNPDTGASFILINNDGADPVIGTFNALPSGALLTSGAVTYQISYTGGDGNDVTLTRVVGAPPSTISPLAFSNGVPVLSGVGLPGVPYVLEATADLNVPIPWQPILTNTADGAGVYQFLDFGGTNFPMRFYRVLSP